MARSERRRWTASAERVDSATSCLIRRRSLCVGATGTLDQLLISGGPSFVAVMKTADLRNRDDDLARFRVLNGAVLGAVHLERRVRPGPVIVGEVAREEPAQVGRVEHDDVVQTLATDAADQPRC
jgi:hypothetical protein